MTISEEAHRYAVVAAIFAKACQTQLPVVVTIKLGRLFTETCNPIDSRISLHEFLQILSDDDFISGYDLDRIARELRIEPETKMCDWLYQEMKP